MGSDSRCQSHYSFESILGTDSDTQDSTYDLSGLLALDRPIRPIFISPASTLLGGGASGERDFYPIVCVSASKLVGVDEIGRAFGFVYVPGAGDDAEAWSKVSLLTLISRMLPDAKSS